MAPPFKEAEFDILFGEGISKESELIELGVKLGIIEKSGAWYSYSQRKLGQGSDNVRLFLKADSALANEIQEHIVNIDSDKKKNVAS